MVESEVRGSTPKGSSLCFTSRRSEIVLELKAAASNTLRLPSALSYNTPPRDAAGGCVSILPPPASQFNLETAAAKGHTFGT